MGEELIMNREYVILKGELEGTVGKLTEYNSLENKAVLKLDELTAVVTHSDNLQLIEID